jgi:hypothetical protein
MPWEIGDGTYRDARWRGVRNVPFGATVCEETGAHVNGNGECPVHKGDACLHSSSWLLLYWIERTEASESSLDTAEKKLEEADLRCELLRKTVREKDEDLDTAERERDEAREAARELVDRVERLHGIKVTPKSLAADSVLSDPSIRGQEE